jgi:YVTN family beta-propeller protein
MKAAQALPTVIATISFGSSRTGVIGANPATNKVYAAREDDPSIAVINGNTNTVITTIPTAGYHLGLAVNSDTNRIYVSQQFAGAVRVIDGSTDTVITDFGVPGLVHTIGDVDVNPATNIIYVIRANNNDISVHDGGTHAQLATVSCLGTCHSGNLAVNSSTNRIYVTNPPNNTVTVIDGVTNMVITTISVGDHPVSVDVNPVTNLIYVVNVGSSNLSVIDGVTNTVVDTIPVGTSPLGVGVNPETNRIYVANYGSDSLSIIDGSTNTVISTVGVGSQPAGVAVNPATSRVYVANGGSNSVSVIEDIIVYNFTGFFQPVDNLPIFNSVKAGSAIPVKFSLSGDQGLNIFAANYPKSQDIACESTAPVDGIEATVTAGSSSLSYDASTDTYTYVWKTEKAWAGTCRQLVVKLNDGTFHRANFKFK